MSWLPSLPRRYPAFRSALAGCALLGSMALVACTGADAEVPDVVAPAPTVEFNDVVSPGLTRSADDIFRQSRHMATIIASRPTAVPVTAADAMMSADGDSALSIPPTPVGVWWWRGSSGDFTPAGVLRSHDYGLEMDLLDGVLDYHDPVGNYPAVAEYYRENVARMLLTDFFSLLRAGQVLDVEPKASDLDEAAVTLGNSLGWEVVDLQEPLARYWGTVTWDGQVYRVGGLVRFAVVAWPYGVEHGTFLQEGAIPSEFVGTAVVERVG